MANLTITVDAETLRRARIRALERGESVNAHLAECLNRYAGGSPQRDVITRVFDLADKAGAGSAATGRSWTRDDLHRV